jgi:hypothetical protein
MMIHHPVVVAYSTVDSHQVVGVGVFGAVVGAAIFDNAAVETSRDILKRDTLEKELQARGGGDQHIRRRIWTTWNGWCTGRAKNPLF